MDSYSLLIGIFGGILFTMLWEAKSRYVFPYLLLLLPYAAAGMYGLMEGLESRIPSGKLNVVAERKNENISMANEDGAVK